MIDSLAMLLVFCLGLVIGIAIGSRDKGAKIAAELVPILREAIKNLSKEAGQDGRGPGDAASEPKSV